MAAAAAARAAARQPLLHPWREAGQIHRHSASAAAATAAAAAAAAGAEHSSAPRLSLGAWQQRLASPAANDDDDGRSSSLKGSSSSSSKNGSSSSKNGSSSSKNGSSSSKNGSSCSKSSCSEMRMSDLERQQQRQVVMWNVSKACPACKKEVREGSLEYLPSSCAAAWRFLVGYSVNKRACGLMGHMHVLRYGDLRREQQRQLDFAEHFREQQQQQQ
ncbi:hypothetical protein Esti_006074 [Eimeria stiedai]